MPPNTSTINLNGVSNTSIPEYNWHTHKRNSTGKYTIPRRFTVRNGKVFEKNDIGRIMLRTALPLFYDSYRKNRTTGSFILVEEGTNITVGAGMII